ncbi:MAG: SRPBCC domain-containing protein [Pseudomonadota bacterium]
MSMLKIERTFPVAPEKVFAFVTRTDHLLKWWGPEGVSMKEHNLDLSRPGAWSSTLVNSQGALHKMSGEVLTVDPPNSVEFTWGWHDDKDQRGHETRVLFEVRPSGDGGTLFILTHSGLTDDEAAANHKLGWTSSLGKLERLPDLQP